MTACCYDNPELVQALLQNGADITSTEHEEKTVLNLAAFYDQPKVLKVLKILFRTLRIL